MFVLVTTILNPAPGKTNILPELYTSCDILCPNEVETEILTGIPVISVHDAYKALDILLDRGCRTVIITLGSQGVVYARSDDRKVVHVAARKVQAVDTTVSYQDTVTRLFLKLDTPSTCWTLPRHVGHCITSTFWTLPHLNMLDTASTCWTLPHLNMLNTASTCWTLPHLNMLDTSPICLTLPQQFGHSLDMLDTPSTCWTLHHLNILDTASPQHVGHCLNMLDTASPQHVEYCLNMLDTASPQHVGHYSNMFNTPSTIWTLPRHVGHSFRNFHTIIMAMSLCIPHIHIFTLESYYSVTRWESKGA